MPTFFRRKYMRPLTWVGTTEKILGGALMLLLCGIVTLMVVQSITDEDYLFNVDKSAHEESIPEHGAAVAAEMLPSPDGASWQATADAESIPTEDWPAELGTMYTDANAFGVRSVYRRPYRIATDAGGEFTVTICDMATPASAFGLWHARQPAETEKLVAGQDGWISASPNRAAFWDGRYYTELQSQSDSATPLATAASALASLQLHFGRPFEAESMLPPQGRVPGSLRYLNRSAFGIDSLDKVFAVDLQGNVTAWVAPTTPGLIDRITAAASIAAPSEGDYGEDDAEPKSAEVQHEGPLTIVPNADGVIAIFTSGAYVHGACGPSRAAVIATAMSAHAIHAVSQDNSFSGAPKGSVPAAKDNPFPDLGSTDWRPPRDATTYTADNLYAKINGRASAYIQYNVVGMTFGTYYHQSETDRTIDVYWYDMGESTNAFGIYGFEAAHDATPVEIGTDGYEVGGAVFFRKGGSYVQVLPATPNESDAQVALEIAKRIADTIRDEDDQIWAMTALPASNRVDGSFTYIAQDAFGQDFLGDVFTIEYDTDGGRVTLFIHRAEDEQASRQLLSQYVDFFEEYGHVIWKDADPARNIVAGDVSGIVDVVFAKGRYLGGAAGVANAERAKRAAIAFFDELEEQR